MGDAFFEVLLGFLSVILVVTAWATVRFKNLLNSVIALSIFNITLVVVFSVLQAPDVAMAEAVIGAGLVTALFLAALNRVEK